MTTKPGDRSPLKSGNGAALDIRSHVAEVQDWGERRRMVEAIGVLIVAALSAMLALQGWKSRAVNFDLITAINSAQELIDTGRLPDRGVVTSLGSFTPPGAVWFALPGVLVFRDPRLFEYAGSVALFLGTLFGTFLLTRRYLGSRCALLAVALYAFSEPGLLAASSLWQRYPIHTFYVWMVYWATRWVDDDNPYFLGLSVLTWALGMYVFLEIAPAIFAIPVVWLLSQSSVRIAPLAAAVVVAALAWFPYLRFETSRNFVDVRSQVLWVALWPADYKQSWCDPGVAPAGWLGDDESANKAIDRETRESASTQPPSKVRLIVEELLLANFRTSRLPGIPAAAILLLEVAGTWVLFMARGTPLASRGNTEGVTRVVIGLAIASMLGALIFNEALAARYLSPDATLGASTVQAIRLLQAALLAAGLVFVCHRRVIAGAVIRVHQWMSSRATKTWPLAVSLVVPWLILLFLSETDRRFLWLWPMQVIALAAVAIHVPRRIGASRFVPLASLALVAIVATNSVTLSRLRSWARDGWAGREAIEVQLVDRLAGLANADNDGRPSIGYEIDIWQFMAVTNAVDPAYRVGADLDLLLKYRHGIVNLDRCAEGFSKEDTYRIVQVEGREGIDAVGRNRIRAARDSRFHLTDQIGPYQVFQRH